MSNPKEKDYYFYVVNIKIRNKRSKKDVAESEYAKLFKKLFNSKIHKPSSNLKHCIIKNLFEEKEGEKLLYFYGVLAQFTFIEGTNWFDLEKMDLDEEFKTPSGKFPDAKQTEYLFVPSAHRFAYLTNSKFNSNPYTIKRFFEEALKEIVDEKKYIDVDVESDKSTIEKILTAPILKKLIIDVNYSNTDIGNDVQKFFDDDMKSANVSRTIIESTNKKDSTIQVKQSKILLGAIESSLSNGETEARIENQDGKAETIKTKDFPLRLKVYSLASRMTDLLYDKIIQQFRNGNKTNKRAN